MADTVAVPVATGVVGDITSCGVETSTIRIDKTHVFSPTQTRTEVSYNLCTKQIVATYTVPEFTDFGALLSILGVGLLMCVVLGFIAHRVNR